MRLAGGSNLGFAVCSVGAQAFCQFFMNHCDVLVDQLCQPKYESQICSIEPGALVPPLPHTTSY